MCMITPSSSKKQQLLTLFVAVTVKFDVCLTCNGSDNCSYIFKAVWIFNLWLSTYRRDFIEWCSWCETAAWIHFFTTIHGTQKCLFFCKSPLQARYTLCEKGAVLLQFERVNFAFMIKFLISNHLVHYVGEWWLFVFIEFFRKSYQMRFNISDVKASLISSLNSHFEGLKVSLC